MDRENATAQVLVEVIDQVHDELLARPARPARTRRAAEHVVELQRLGVLRPMP
ncbi:hypothetical protein [Streptomyces sp. NTH33]|uniref:hypothetical protein n=1 Tax=Streptomyces sp. NTH33 TaxID=1735453 RepID=UPI0015E8CCD5|nr:hypothetical protein [Streptomyces sp. NTH33]